MRFRNTVFKVITRLLFVHISYYLIHIPKKFEQLINIKILRKHKVAHLLKSMENKGKDVAIFAIYPRSSQIRSITRIIDFLITHNFHIICVLNSSENTNEISEHLLKFPVTIIIRENYGRDFGAYQSGINYLKHNGIKPNYLLLLNDSVYYFQKTKISFLDGKYKNYDWFSLFENYEYHFHAQSFFTGYSRKILENKDFIKFWENYYPSNERRHSIDKGEVALSQIILRAGFNNYSVINPFSLRKVLNKATPRQNELRVFYEEHISDFTRDSMRKSKLDKERINADFQWKLMTTNPTHSLGLYISRTMNLPLKLDLLKSGVCTLDDVLINSLELGLEDSEMNDLKNQFMSAGTVATEKGLRRHWKNHGLI